MADLRWADASAAPRGAAGSGPAVGPRELSRIPNPSSEPARLKSSTGNS